MLVYTVVGARPQFMKAAVVMKALEQQGAQQCLVHTGQHYDKNMSDIFFSELGITEPDYHLGIGSGGHGAQTGQMLEAIERSLLEVRPDWVLVYGDTNSTLAGALAAAKLHIPIAHVEAGLRSFNKRMPEEINRVLTDHVSDLLFAPTNEAEKNLAAEGVSPGKVLLTGDVMYDAALHYAAAAELKSNILQHLQLKSKEYILATIHRAENTDVPAVLRGIFEGISQIAKDVPVIMPLHPRTLAALKHEGLLEGIGERIHIIEPVGYLDMIMLEKNARLIVTDSGGVQKEAFFYRVPCVTLRSETEWVETVALGWNHVVPPVSKEAVFQSIETALLAPIGKEGQPYGEGRASTIIAGALTDSSKGHI
ncbi:MAG TPA: UDP-N-acetylglucosamine 2-epimerase (non-hydrolyzing) [Abditibacteriaceae bacterium]|jgi:UDP-GlcNAc3NAcA epimerase